MRKVLINLLFVFVIFIAVSNSSITSNGEDILDEVDRVLNTESSDYTITMIIINSDGYERERRMRIVSKGNDRGFVRFLGPADIEGTGFLTVTEEGEENMWLYLPALGNVRRIASHQKGSNFMGTDFTYKDISIIAGSNYCNDYKSELIGEEEYDNSMCLVLESLPVDEDIDYSKMKMWVRNEDYMPLKLEFYDIDDKLLKVMTNFNIKEKDGHLMAGEIVMENVQKGTKTILYVDKIMFDLEIPDSIFTIRYLQRG